MLQQSWVAFLTLTLIFWTLYWKRKIYVMMEYTQQSVMVYLNLSEIFGISTCILGLRCQKLRWNRELSTETLEKILITMIVIINTTLLQKRCWSSYLVTLFCYPLYKRIPPCKLLLRAKGNFDCYTLFCQICVWNCSLLHLSTSNALNYRSLSKFPEGIALSQF